MATYTPEATANELLIMELRVFVPLPFRFLRIRENLEPKTSRGKCNRSEIKRVESRMQASRRGIGKINRETNNKNPRCWKADELFVGEHCLTTSNLGRARKT
jgi:hypothetical protein